MTADAIGEGAPSAVGTGRPTGSVYTTKAQRWEGHLSTTGRLVIILFAGAFPLIVLPSTLVNDTDILPKVLLARAVVITLALLCVARAAIAGRINLRRTPLDLPAAAIVLSAGLSTLVSVNPTLSMNGSYTRYEGLITIATYAGLLWLSVQFVVTRDQGRRALRAMLIGAALECLLASAQSLSTSAGTSLGAFGETATTFGGVARALGTMANANNLAIWLAMLLPVAAGEALSARSRWARPVAVLLAALMAVTLALTFGRGAWVGAACGMVLTAALHLSRASLRRAAIAVAAALGVVVVLAAAVSVAGRDLGVPLLSTLGERLLSLANPASGSGSTRLHLYSDTLGIVAQRPLVGFGPDTFGLVDPSRASGNWTPGVVIDKAHSDILQVAATQGLLGVAAELWFLLALARILVRGRRLPGVAGVAGAALAYEIGIQVNFAWFPVTAPFWLLAAVAAVMTASPWEVGWALPQARVARTSLVVAAAVVATVAMVTLSALPLAANIDYHVALARQAAGERASALTATAAACALQPGVADYQALQGDLEADLVGNRPGSAADLRAAQESYQRAIADGDILPTVPVRLAYVDLAMGETGNALRAAEVAQQLQPYGPAATLVTQLGG
jgi:O-antigen ligase